MTEQQKQINSNVHTPIWADIFLKNNVNVDLIPFLLSQIILESGWFSSNAYIFDHNPSGITWNNNYKTRPGTSIGTKRPSNEGGNYVHFALYDTAAKDFIRILNKQSINNTIGKPINATSLTDFSKRLKLNGYFTSSESSYTNALKSISKRNQQWNDVTTLLKKKNSINMAGLNPVIILFLLSFLILKK